MDFASLIQAECQKPHMVHFRDQLPSDMSPFQKAHRMADYMFSRMGVRAMLDLFKKVQNDWQLRLAMHEPDEDDMSPSDKASRDAQHVRAFTVNKIYNHEEQIYQREYPGRLLDLDEYVRREAAGEFDTDNESWDGDDNIARHMPTPSKSKSNSPVPTQQSAHPQAPQQVTNVPFQQSEAICMLHLHLFSRFHALDFKLIHRLYSSKHKHNPSKTPDSAQVPFYPHTQNIRSAKCAYTLKSYGYECILRAGFFWPLTGP